MNVMGAMLLAFGLLFIAIWLIWWMGICDAVSLQERLYARFEDVEAKANAALEAHQWELHDYFDRESQKLCARLGY